MYGEGNITFQIDVEAKIQRISFALLKCLYFLLIPPIWQLKMAGMPLLKLPTIWVSCLCCTNYHKVNGLTWHKFNSLTVLWVRGYMWVSLGKNWGNRASFLSGGFIENLWPLPPFRGCRHSLTHGPFFHPQKPAMISWVLIYHLSDPLFSHFKDSGN